MSFFLFLVYIVLSFFRPVELFAPELASLRPMLWLWLLAFIAATSQAMSRERMACRGVHLALLGAFSVFIALSHIATGWFGGAVDALNKFSPSLMLFVLVVLNVTTMERLRLTCQLLLATMVLTAATSIYAYHTGNMAEQLVLRQNSGLADEAGADSIGSTYQEAASAIPAQEKSGWFLWRLRGMGFLNDPNDFAQALVMVLPLLWGAWQPGAGVANLLRVLLPGSIVAYAIVLTQSRGAIVGIAAMLFFGVRRLLGPVRTGVLMGVLGLLAVVGNMAAGRGFSSQERSAEERIEAWEVGIRLLREHPLTGAGYGNFTEYNNLTAHNSFVLCFAEIGLLGYFVWLGLLVLAYRGVSVAVEVLPPGSSARKYAGLMRASLVGFLTCAWFLSRTYSPGLYFISGLCVAAGWLMRQWLLQRAQRLEAELVLMAQQPREPAVPALLGQADVEPLPREEPEFEPAGADIATLQQRLAGTQAALARLDGIRWARDTFVVMCVTIVAVYGFIVLHRLSGA